jgi:tetratricopeptide (TPR) repeat protein
MKALDKDRNRRYETAAALARDIQRYLDGDRVEAAAPSTAYILRKAAVKYRVPLGIAGAFTVLLIAAAVVSTVEAVRARQAQQESEAVNSFLQNDLLAQATADSQAAWNTRPEPDIKVRTVLDRAAQSVGAKFGAQPLVEAAVRSTIGQSYYGLGLYSPAREQFNRALELRRRLQGENHPETLKTLGWLGIDAGALGDFKAARALSQQALAGKRRVLGPEHPDTLHEMANLARAMIKLADYEAAEILCLQAIEAQL